jgi:hypothetical protein
MERGQLQVLGPAGLVVPAGAVVHGGCAHLAAQLKGVGFFEVHSGGFQVRLPVPVNSMPLVRITAKTS